MTTQFAPTADRTDDQAGFVGRIPIRNIWFLLLYSSDLYRELDTEKRDIESSPDEIPDLVAEILCRRVEQRLRRNLSRGYRQRSETLTRVRGKIDLLNTYAHQLLYKGSVACRFEELTLDTPRNRYVRAALSKISTLVTKPALRHDCRSLAGTLERMGVSGESPTTNELESDQIGRHHRDDIPMIAAAKLAFSLLLLTEDAGSLELPAPDRNEHWLRKLFEKGICGLYSVALPKHGWQVTPSKRLLWQIDQHTSGINDVFPTMETDIYLKNPALGRLVIIDTKFTSVLKPGRRGNLRLKSNYLYQLYAYLRTQEKPEEPLSLSSAGLLLHPTVDTEFDEFVEIQGHKLRFVTVDLTETASNIRERLLNIALTM